MYDKILTAQFIKEVDKSKILSNKSVKRNPILREDGFWSEFFFRIGNGESIRGVSKDLGLPFQSVWSSIMADEQRRSTYDDAKISRAH